MKNRKKKRMIALLSIVLLSLSPCLPFLQGSMLVQAAGFTIQMKNRRNMLTDVVFDFFGERIGSGIYYWMKNDGSPLLCVQQHARLGEDLTGAEVPEGIGSGTYFTSSQYELVSLVLQCCGMRRGENGDLEPGAYLAAQAAVWGILSPNWLGTEQLAQEMENLHRHVRNWGGASAKEMIEQSQEMVETICQAIEEHYGDQSRYIPSFASKYEEKAPTWQAQRQEDGSCQMVFERGDKSEAIRDFLFRLPDGWSYRWEGDQVIFSCQDPEEGMIAVTGTAMEGSLLSEAMPIGLIYIAWPADRPHYQHLASGVDVTVPLRCYFRIYIPPRAESQGSWYLPGGELYRHQEDLVALYGVELEKTDGDTKTPLEGVQFQVLEYFDAGQLEGTILDKEQLESWDGWKARCEKQFTGGEGRISHWDKKVYHYEKTYCGGHPDPKIVYEGSSDRVQEQLEEEAWEAWEEAVEACAQVCDHHAVDGSGMEALEAERDRTYAQFTGLVYGYTFVETEPLEGYRPFGEGGKDQEGEIGRIFCVSAQAGGRYWEESEQEPEQGPGKESEQEPEQGPEKGSEQEPEQDPGKRSEQEPEQGPEKGSEQEPEQGPEKESEQGPEQGSDEQLARSVRTVTRVMAAAGPDREEQAGGSKSKTEGQERGREETGREEKKEGLAVDSRTGSSTDGAESVLGQGGSADDREAVPGQSGSADGAEAVPGQSGSADGAEAVPGQSGSADGAEAVPGQPGSADDGESVLGQGGGADDGESVLGQGGSVEDTEAGQGQTGKDLVSAGPEDTGTDPDEGAPSSDVPGEQEETPSVQPGGSGEDIPSSGSGDSLSDEEEEREKEAPFLDVVEDQEEEGSPDMEEAQEGAADLGTRSDAIPHKEEEEEVEPVRERQRKAQKRTPVWLTSLVEPLEQAELEASCYCFYVENFRIEPPKESEPEESQPEETQPVKLLLPDSPGGGKRSEALPLEPPVSLAEALPPRIGWIEAAYTPPSSLLIGDEDTPRSGRERGGGYDGMLPGTGDRGLRPVWLFFIMTGAVLLAAGLYRKKKQIGKLFLCVSLLPVSCTAFSFEVRAEEGYGAELVLYLAAEGGETPQERYLDEQGREYKLYFYRPVDQEIPMEQRILSETRIYTGLENTSQIPDMLAVEDRDEESGRVGTGWLRPKEDLEIGSSWSDDLTIPVIFHGYDADQFELQGIMVPKEDALRHLLEEQSALLEAIGCEQGYYKIEEIVWDGEDYMDQGVLCRKAWAKGRKLLTDHQVLYEGTVLYPASIEKKWEARYRLVLAPEPEEKKEEAMPEELKEPALETAVPAPEPIVQGDLWRSVRTFAAYTVSFAVLLPVLFFFAAAWKKRRRSV